jgi:hypothetical protein
VSTNPVTWDIYQTRSTAAKWLGTVEATDTEAAIKEATKQFAVKDPKRLIAIRRR